MRTQTTRKYAYTLPQAIRLVARFLDRCERKNANTPEQENIDALIASLVPTPQELDAIATLETVARFVRDLQPDDFPLPPYSQYDYDRAICSVEQRIALSIEPSKRTPHQKRILRHCAQTVSRA